MTGNYFVYITTNPARTVLYTGITKDLKVRLAQHYNERGNKRTFAGRYYCYNLVYFEHFSEVNQAIFREKMIKNMKRMKKEELIKFKNPGWKFINNIS